MGSVRKGFGATIGVVLALIFLLFCVCTGCVCLLGVSKSHGAELESNLSYIGVGYVGGFPEQPLGFYFVFTGPHKWGVYLDGKLSKFVDQNKVYNFSIDRAEHFYKSKFMGIQKESNSVGIGVSYSILLGDTYTPPEIFQKYGSSIVIPYVALRYYSWTNYRKYHDDTFRVWQNDYLLKDNPDEESMKSNNKLGISFGCIVGMGPLNLNFGYDMYSKNHGNWNVGIGIGCRWPI